ncbi:hypothetical protein HHI36_010561 [Cryptolaemus montrouzieri]|uniref:MADF domain-containing protein n=1 Tax=Cryptolaemus montrouzieri TaxID=559131 RepID=A0ABD2MJ68_9CUCU
MTDLLAFLEKLSEVEWSDIYEMKSDVNQVWECFSNQYKKIFDESFPRIRVTPFVALRPFMQSPLYFVKKRYDLAVSHSRKEHFNNFILKSQNKSRAVWQIVNTLDGRNSSSINTMKQGNSNNLANEFNDYFYGITRTLTQNMSGKPNFECTHNKRNDKSFYVFDVSETEVINIVFIHQ